MKITAKQAAEMLARAPRLVPSIAPKAAFLAAHRTKAALIKVSPVDTGGFKNAWAVRRGTGKTLARVENLHPIAGVIERGARPHPVSLEGQAAIKRWVLRKGLAKYEDVPIEKLKRGQFGPAQRLQGPGRIRTVTNKTAHDHEEAVDRIVQGIVNKLRTKGQKGLFLMRRHMPKAAQWFRDECRRLIEAELKKGPQP